MKFPLTSRRAPSALLALVIFAVPLRPGMATSVSANKQAADVEVSVSVDPESPSEGETVTISIAVANTGDAGVTGVKVIFSSEIAEALTFSTFTPSQGSFNSETGVWTIGAISAASTATADFAATFTGASAVAIVSAEVSEQNEVDADSTPGNGVRTEDDMDVIGFYQADYGTDAGFAGSFDGADDFVSIPSAGALDLTDTFTLMAWVRPDATDDGYVISHDALNSDTNNAFALYLSSGGMGYETNNAGSFSAPGTVPTGSWSHLAVTHDSGDDPNTRLYVNGALVGSGNVATPAATGTGLLLGRRGVGSFFDGLMDEVSLWNATLSPGDIRSRMLDPLNGDEGGLIAYYRFDENGGSSAIDAAGSGHVGTMTSGATWAASSVPMSGVPDVSLAMTSSTTRANSGDEIDYTITLRNDSPVATGVTIKTFFPDGNADFEEATASSGTYTAGTGMWTIQSLSGGGVETLDVTLTSRVENEPLVFEAEIIDVDQGDTDSTPGTSDHRADSFAYRAVLPNVSNTGTVLLLDGTDDYVQIFDSAALDAPDAMTVEAWVNITKAGHVNLFTRTDTGVFEDGAYGLNILSNGSLEWDVRNFGFVVSPAGLVSRDTWHHVAVTWDADAIPALTLFVDGNIVRTEPNEGGGLIPGASDRGMLIGSRGADLNFGGQIDEFLFWNTARTPQQILAGLLDPFAGNETGLTAYHRYDVKRNLKVNDDGADDAQDHSGHALHGDLQGGANIVQSQTPKNSTSVSATDDIFEDHVLVGWELGEEPATLVRILRDGQLLSVLSSETEEYADENGVPNTVHMYCVVTEDANGNRTTLGCDGGRRRHFLPTDVQASDKLFTDFVRIVWDDNSVHNTGYELFRDDELIAELGPNTEIHDDEGATPETVHTYCVVPIEDGVEGNARVCEDGERADALPALQVAATDGTIPNLVRVTWLDQGEGTTGFEIRRDGTLMTTVEAAVLSWDDVSPTTGTVHSYCVRRLTASDASIDRCDDGSINTLPAPTQVLATDGAFDDRIEVEWKDVTSLESGYNVYRTGGAAIVFDGNDDHLALAADPTLDRESQTFEAWLRPTAFGVVRTLIEKGGDPRNFDVLLLADGRVHLAAHNRTCSELQTVSSAAPLVVDEWAHVAVAVSETSGTIYIDGVESATISLGGICRTTNAISIGGGRWDSFEGTMDEIRLWSATRTQAQIRANLYRTLSGTENGLLAYWSLDTGSGSQANDEYGIHSGAFTGFADPDAAWTTDTAPVVQYDTGLSLRLDGDDDHVRFEDASMFDLSQFTIETWLNPSAAAESAETIVAKQKDDGTAVNYAFTRQANGHLRLTMGSGACLGAFRPFLDSTTPVPVEQWTHAAVSYDGTTARMYINGVLDRELEALSPICQNAEPLLIGGGVNDGFAGRLDRTRLWNVARAVHEIVNAMQRNVADTESGLVLALAFDTIVDSGSGNAGFNDTPNTASSPDPDVIGGAQLTDGVPNLLSQTSVDADSYVDLFAEQGVLYSYCIATFTDLGVETSSECDSGRRSAAIGPENVAASDAAFEDRVEITWSSQSTRTSIFKIYRDGDLIKTTPSTTFSFTDSGIASDTDLTYCVSAVSAEGVESVQDCDDGSRSIAAPTQVEATNGIHEGRVNVTWVDNSEIERGYRVYRRLFTNLADGTLAADSTLVEETVASQAEAIDRGGIPGATYRYSVVAFDADGFSKIGSRRGMRRLRPPTLLAAEDGINETRVNMTWEDRSNIETGYRIYRDDVLIDTIGKNRTSYTDQNPPFGQQVTYGVEAFEDLGASAHAEDTGSTRLLTPGTVSASDLYSDRVTVTWVDRSSVETGYRIYRNNQFLADVGTNVTSYDDGTASAGVSVTYCAATLSGGVETSQVCDVGFIFVPADPPAFIPLEHSLTSHDGETSDEFGIEVSIAGDQLMIGSMFHDDNTGAVYVYERQSSGWVFRQKLIASDSKEGARFGQTIDMTSSWAVIGAPFDVNTVGSSRLDSEGLPVTAGGLEPNEASAFGRVYFFKRTPDGWEESQAFTHDFLEPNSRYGEGVSTDGNFALVLAPGDNSLYVLKRTDDTWEAVSGIGHIPADHGAIDGEFVALTAEDYNDGGFVKYIERIGSTWTEGGSFRPISLAVGGGSFGSAVDIEQGIVAIGARSVTSQNLANSGAVYIYELEDRFTANLIQEIHPDEHLENLQFGKSVAFSRGRLLVGASNSAYLFERGENGLFDQVQIYKGDEATPDFGRNVALSQDGMLVVGDPAAGYGHPTGGQVFFLESDPADPTGVSATNGKFENRVEISWTDLSDNEDGFQIFRDGELIEVSGADVTSYSDENAVPGNVHNYCVQSIRSVYGNTSGLACDIGWRFPDGAIAGKVSSRIGDAAQNIEVCLAPTPNGSLAFDGIAGSAGTSDTTTLPSSFSIEFWAKRSAGETGWDVVMSHGSRSANGGLIIGFRPDDTFTFGFFQNDLNGPQITDVNWHHFAMTYDSSTNARIIYMDGEEIDNDISSSDYVGDGSFFLGSFMGDTDYFNGQLDEVRIWNHVLSQQSIQNRMFETIDPTLPNLGLFAHWSLDERDGDYSANDVDESGSFYLNHNGGVHPSRPGAPIVACDLTDESGDYNFTGIRYGESTEYTVLPQDPGEVIRTFQPARKIINLSQQNPVQNEVPFTDLTQYTVAGTIQFDGTECPVTDVILTVNQGSSQGQADEEGDYSLAIDPGPASVEPTVAGAPDRIFSPEVLAFQLSDDAFEQNFVDETVRTLSGKVVGTGMCELPIGRATIEIRARNGCLVQEVQTDENGNYEVDLPPMEYTVKLLEIENDDSQMRVDIEKYFEEEGPQLVDISEADSVHDLIYRPPLKVTIGGMAASQCNTGDIPDNLPILAKGEPLNLQISVSEDLGAMGECPVDAATVTLFSEISDQTNEPLVFEIGEGDGGVVDTTLVIGQPNVLAGRVVDGVDRSYQKFITAAAEVGARTAESTEWAVVEGVRPRPGGRFATAPATHIPTWILRDPPGDHSYAYIEKGSERCSTIMAEASLSVALGYEITASVGAVIDVGVAFGGEASVVFQQLVILGGSIEASLRQTFGGGVELCTSALETISTSDDEDFFGPPADLFVGAGVNFIFAKADRVAVNECSIDLDDTIAFGPKLDTGFAFTRDHIENRMIPDLAELEDASTSPDSVEAFSTAIDNWERMLVDSDKTKNSDDLSEFGGGQLNRSFSAGANLAYAKSHNTTGSFFTKTTIGLSSSIFIGQKMDVAGNGFEDRLTLSTGIEGTFFFHQTFGSGTSIGYVLSDDDVGDNYSVDITEDPNYGTPIFDVKAGLSSCPYEPWLGIPLVVAGDADPDAIAPRTTPRDIPVLSMSPIVQQNVDPLNPAAFVVNLGNQSASDEVRNYRLTPLRASNPGGAVMWAGGQLLTSDGIDFTIPPGEVHQTALTVERGPVKYDYPRLGLTLLPICEVGNLDRGNPNTADSLYFDLSFKPPCSPVNIFRPKENWMLSRETAQDPLEVILDEFTLDATDVDPGVQFIVVEYRRMGTEDWLPAFQVSRQQIIAQGGEDADSYIGEWNFADVDGAYELRAYTNCDSGKTYSDVVVGVVDTKRPLVLETPEPADGVLNFGDDISVTLDEDVLCSSIITGGQNPNTFLRRTDTDEAIAIEATCDGRTAVLAPQDPNVLDEVEGLVLEVELEEWTDLVGNPVPQPVSFSFEVRRSAFAWSPASASRNLALGTSATFEATLTNGKTNEAVDFEISVEDSWLVPNITEGTLPAQSQASIGFTIRDVLQVGVHEMDVTATNDDGDVTILTLTVEVFDECFAPSWAVVPSNFQHNMTLTSQLLINAQVSKDEQDIVAAFVGDQLRGVASVVPIDANEDTIPDGNRVSLVIYSNQATGEQVTFQVWDASSCTIHEETNLNLSFDATAVHGSPTQPVTLQAPPPPAVPGSVALSSGWTWFSINIEPDNPVLSTVLTNLPAVESDIVKSQTAFSMFDPTAGWVGTLSSLDPRKGYLIRLNQSALLNMVGSEVDPVLTPIDLVSGWNWIGYLPAQAQDVNDALSSLEPATNDIIKSQFAFAQFVEGAGWIGSLAEMNPGLGYQIRLASADILEYPEPPVAAKAVQGALIAASLESQTDMYAAQGDGIALKSGEAGLLDEDIAGRAGADIAAVVSPPKPLVMSSAGLECVLQPSDYEHSLTLTAVLSVDGQEIRGEGWELGAFDADDACRGVASLQYVESLDRWYAFLVLYGKEDGEEIGFRVFRPEDDAIMTSDLKLSFASNAVIGSIQHPEDVGASLTSTALEDGSQLPLKFALEANYPNPFDRTTRIGYSLPTPETVRLTVFDVLGRQVARLVQEDQAAGQYEVLFDGRDLAAGTYAYRIEAGGFVETRFLILMR